MVAGEKSKTSLVVEIIHKRKPPPQGCGGGKGAGTDQLPVGL